MMRWLRTHQTMRAEVRRMQIEVQDANYTIHALIRAAGGRIVVTSQVMKDLRPPQAMITSYCDQATGDMVYEAS